MDDELHLAPEVLNYYEQTNEAVAFWSLPARENSSSGTSRRRLR